jgi:hypothetical protein
MGWVVDIETSCFDDSSGPISAGKTIVKPTRIAKIKAVM